MRKELGSDEDQPNKRQNLITKQKNSPSCPWAIFLL